MHDQPMAAASLHPARPPLDETTVGALQAAVGVLTAKWSLAVLARLASGTQPLQRAAAPDRRRLAAHAQRHAAPARARRARRAPRLRARARARGVRAVAGGRGPARSRSTPLAGWGLENREALLAARALFDDRLQAVAAPRRRGAPGAHARRRRGSSSALTARAARARSRAGPCPSRQRAIFAPWRMRSLLVWSNVTSTTSSGPQLDPLELALVRPAARVARAALARSRTAASLAGSSRFSLALKPEVWPTGRSAPSVVVERRGSASRPCPPPCPGASP